MERPLLKLDFALDDRLLCVSLRFLDDSMPPDLAINRFVEIRSIG